MERGTKRISRQEIQEGGVRNQEQLQESGERLTVVADDADIVQETLDSLSGEETSDTLEIMEQSIEVASEVAGTEFDREAGEMEQVQQESRERESDLDNRSHATETDLNHISDAGGRIQTENIAQELMEAKDGALQELDFFKEEITQSQEAIAENERIRQEQANRMQAARRVKS